MAEGLGKYIQSNATVNNSLVWLVRLEKTISPEQENWSMILLPILMW